MRLNKQSLVNFDTQFFDSNKNERWRKKKKKKKKKERRSFVDKNFLFILGLLVISSMEAP